MYTDPDPQYLAPVRSLETGQECLVFRRADLATLRTLGWVTCVWVGSALMTFWVLGCVGLESLWVGLCRVGLNEPVSISELTLHDADVCMQSIV